MAAEMPLVKDAMRREIYFIESEAPVSKAIGIFKEHKEKHGETHLIHCRARLNTDKVQLIGVGESWTPALAARIALDVIERKFLVMKENMRKYPYAEELLTKIASEV